MKSFKILLLLFFLATVFSVDAMSPANGNNGNHYGQRNFRNNSPHKAPPVGAPLDGGLLTVLGAGGIAYYIARRKSKKLES
jgi:hypothetical protein